jgi:hypothetical protein
VRVTVVRRGGLAGVALHGDAETTALPGSAAAAAEGALKKLPAGKAAAAPAHPDGFHYELSFEGQSAALDESEVTDELRPLIDAAMAHAKLG